MQGMKYTSYFVRASTLLRATAGVPHESYGTEEEQLRERKEYKLGTQELK